jgi:nicotinamide mononucleotide transporter
MRIGKELILSKLEIFAFITSVIGVIYGIFGPRVTWPWWIISSLAYAVLFYQSKYFASAALQFIFIAAGIAGWFGWGKAGAKPRFSSYRERVITFFLLVISTAALFPILKAIGTISSFIEGFGFAGSLIAQMLMVWQRFEAWPLWFVVDAAYTFQYFNGGLILTGILYFIFTLLAIWGWIRWLRESKKFNESI